MKLTWTDKTSYSRGERGKAEPREWEAEVGSFRVFVHRHRDYEGAWLLSSYDAGVSQRVLVAKELEAAKNEALLFLLGRFKRALEVLERVV